MNQESWWPGHSPKILLCFTEDSPGGAAILDVSSWNSLRPFGPCFMISHVKLGSSCLAFRVEIILSTGQGVRYAWVDWINIWYMFMVVLCLYLITLNYLHVMVGRIHNLSSQIMKPHCDSKTQEAGKLSPSPFVPVPFHCWVCPVIDAKLELSPCSAHSVFLSLSFLCLSLPLLIFLSPCLPWDVYLLQGLLRKIGFGFQRVYPLGLGFPRK